MSGYYGLIELVLVFGLVLGWGLYELRSVRRATREAAHKDAPAKGRDD